MSARIHPVRCLAFACLVFVAAIALAAQTPPTSTHTAHHRKPKAATQAAKPALPPEPPKPDWPVNDRPAPASVSWDQRSLRIDATNSSLEQILTQITAATGAKIEGTGADQRIFGVFGPGRARDVLSQLLQGSGYNVVMVGDNGQGLPREVMLSDRSAAGKAPAVTRPPQPQDDDYDEGPDNSQVDTQPQPPTPPAQPAENQQRTPQQMQEQQMMQQQQAQPGQPQPPQ